MLLMLRMAGNIRSVMWIAAIPAFIAVALLLLFVNEPGSPSPGPLRPRLGDARLLPSRYWLTVLLGGVFALARFSEAFLILRARDAGLGISWVPLVMIVMNLCYAAGAYPAGAAADRVNHRSLILSGIMLLIAADLTLALAPGPGLVFAGTALWGLHLAFTQGLLAKLVADSVPARLLGTGFGIYNLVNGLALLLASVIAGSLWSLIGAQATFLAGAGFAAAAALGLAAAARRHGKFKAAAHR